MPTAFSSSNNYLSNADQRLPKEVTAGLQDLVTSIELQGARVAKGFEPADEIEHALADFVMLSRRSKPFAADQVVRRMESPASQLSLGGRFAAFENVELSDLASLHAVDLPSIHRPALTGIDRHWAHIPPAILDAAVRPDRLFLPQAEHQGLRFHLSRVRCLDETGSGWWGELGRDEIYCGAVAVDENGETTSGGLFKVGDFNDGDQRNYASPGRQLQYFNLHEGGDTFPKIYTMAVSLVEHDHGNLPEWFNKFLDIVKKKVAEYLSTVIGAAVGSSLGPLGSLIGAAVGWVVGKLVGLVKSWLGDENLGTQTIQATINSYSGNWISTGSKLSREFSRDFKAHSGHYRIYWRAELV